MYTHVYAWRGVAALAYEINIAAAAAAAVVYETQHSSSYSSSSRNGILVLGKNCPLSAVCKAAEATNAL